MVCMRMLLAGISAREIYEAVRSDFQITFRQCQNYIAEATELIKQDFAKDKDFHIATAVNRLNAIYKQSISGKIKNLNAAINAIKEINNLLGLAEPSRSELSLSGDLPISAIQIQIIRSKEELDYYNHYEQWLTSAEAKQIIDKSETKRNLLADDNARNQ